MEFLRYTKTDNHYIHFVKYLLFRGIFKDRNNDNYDFLSTIPDL